MRAKAGFHLPAVLLLMLGMAGPLQAQTGTISGTVTDAETGAPLPDVAVEVLGAEEAQAGGVFTNQAGQYRITLPAGSYSVVFSHLGFEAQRVDGVRVAAGMTEDVSVALTSRAFRLNPIVVTASRREEKALESPASISIVDADIVRQRPAITPVEHVKALPGVDIVQTGIQASNIVTRGFNNVFSGALLVLTDNRYAHVPSLRFNAYNMIPSNDLDLDRIEVSLGPGAALYGPNSASGVMHLITKSPLDEQSTAVQISSGYRSGNNVNSDGAELFHFTGRSAFKLSDQVGFKISGQYFTGTDWEFIDALEQAAGAQRDYSSDRWSFEGRLDYRFADDAELVVSGGWNTVEKSIEMTGLGAGQADGWEYKYLQGRFTKGRLFTQAFINTSSAGNTYLLQTGMPVVDDSRMYAWQLQHGYEVGEMQDFIYGLDLQRTEPRTDGTITGRNEDDDIINEIGGYLHSTTNLSEKVDLVAAVRIDYHNRLEDLIFSPRAALVFHPTEDQNFRLTFNRAFSTPTTNNLFLDIVAGRIDLTDQLGYNIRTWGVPESGFTFNDQCTGGYSNYCMWSPFVVGQTEPMAAMASPFWNGLIEQLIRPQVGDVVADLLLSASPTGPDIGTVLRRFNQEAYQAGENPFPLDAVGPADIKRMEPTITNTFEVGYKGLLGDRVLLAADVYYSSIKDFVGPLRVETPSVFLDPAGTAAYVSAALQPLVLAGALTPAQVQGIIENLAAVPLGTVTPDQADSPDLLLTYRNFGDVDLWGADLAMEVIVTDRFSLSGSASFVSDECFNFSGPEGCGDPQDIALNAPKLKGSVGGRFSDAASGVSFEGRVRYTDGFPMNSGVYIGDIEKYTVFDANIGYRIPWMPGTSVQLMATNLFDDKHQEFIGAPELGRLVVLRLGYEF